MQTLVRNADGPPSRRRTTAVGNGTGTDDRSDRGDGALQRVRTGRR